MKTKIKILDHEIDVIIDGTKPWSSDDMGMCNIKDGTIHVRKNMPKDIVFSVFVHELVHMIAEFNSIELTEQTVDGLALGLQSFIKNNQEFIQDILKPHRTEPCLVFNPETSMYEETAEEENSISFTPETSKHVDSVPSEHDLTYGYANLQKNSISDKKWVVKTAIGYVGEINEDNTWKMGPRQEAHFFDIVDASKIVEAAYGKKNNFGFTYACIEMAEDAKI